MLRDVTQTTAITIARKCRNDIAYVRKLHHATMSRSESPGRSNLPRRQLGRLPGPQLRWTGSIRAILNARNVPSLSCRERFHEVPLTVDALRQPPPPPSRRRPGATRRARLPPAPPVAAAATPPAPRRSPSRHWGTAFITWPRPGFFKSISRPSCYTVFSIDLDTHSLHASCWRCCIWIRPLT